MMIDFNWQTFGDTIIIDANSSQDEVSVISRRSLKLLKN